MGEKRRGGGKGGMGGSGTQDRARSIDNVDCQAEQLGIRES